MKNTLTSVGSIIAAVLASLCCIAPVSLAFLGIGGISAFTVSEAYRPYLIGLTIVLLGSGFFIAYRKQVVKCEDGTCKIESAGIWNKVGVWGATLFVVSAISFPYFGFTAMSSTSGTPDERSLDLDNSESFFNVPLICNAAPAIGCGSRAKFIMLDLMKESAVKEAWLSRNGTVMAVVWMEGMSVASRNTAITGVFTRHELPIDQVSERDRNALVERFKVKETWYKGSDVDALSIEEAGIIADRILSGISPQVSFKRDEDKQAFRGEVKEIFQGCFLSLKSFNELDDSTYNRVEREVIAVGEKYLGKGNMPNPRMMQEDCHLEENGAGCCADEGKEKAH